MFSHSLRQVLRVRFWWYLSHLSYIFRKYLFWLACCFQAVKKVRLWFFELKKEAKFSISSPFFCTLIDGQLPCGWECNTLRTIFCFGCKVLRSPLWNAQPNLMTWFHTRFWAPLLWSCVRSLILEQFNGFIRPFLNEFFFGIEEVIVSTHSFCYPQSLIFLYFATGNWHF